VRAARGRWRKIPEGKAPTQPSAGLDAKDATTLAWATPETVAPLAIGEVLPSVEFQQGDAATCLTCAGAATRLTCPRQWRKIPEGKAPTQPSAGLDATDATTVAWATPETVASLVIGEVLPSVEFQQGDAATCLTCAGANGLFAVGDADGAARVAAAAARTGEQRLTNIKQLGQYIYSSVVGWSPQNPVNFYPGAASDRHCRGLMAHLLAHPSELPTVVTLCDSEGAEDHDVAMVGALIFDSNKPRALPLSQESLDRCVDIERTGLTCTAIARAVRLVPTKKMRRALGLRPAAKEARVAARGRLS
jgi:hypothetical protein